MNKIGINLWNWSATPYEDFVKWINHAANLGFAAVELPMAKLDVPWEEIKKVIDERKLEVTLCASLPLGRDISNFKQEDRENARNYLLQCCEIGGFLGAKVLVGPMYSGGGKCHLLDEEQKKIEWDYAVCGLREIAEAAAKNYLCLGVEPINKYRTSMVNTAKQGLQMINDIDMDNVGLLFDTYQANIGESDIAGALREVAREGKLAHFHACENHRGVPGTGHIDWKALAKVLKEEKYTGHYTMEAFCAGGLDAPWICEEDRDAEAKRGLEYLTSLLTEIE